MNVLIREATINDVKTIHDIWKNISEFYTSDSTITFWPIEILEYSIDKENVLILVAEIEKKIVGFIILNINNSLKKAEVENIYVIPNYRWKWISDNLLKEAINRLLIWKIENVVAMSYEAVDFFSRNWFEKWKNFYWMNLSISDRFKK